MYRLFLIVLCLVLAACSLSSGETDDTAEATLPADDDVLVIGERTEEPEIRPTNTPQPTSTPIASDDDDDSNSGSGNSNGGTVITCTIRTDWQIYTVVRGDTLSSLARRTNSTVNALANANCLNDPGAISVGQQLRVPRQPISENQQAGYVTPSEYISVNGGIYTFRAGQSVTLRWEGASFSGLSQAEFLFYPTGSNNGVTLGVDTYLADGASTGYYVPTNLSGTIVARGARSSGGTRFSADMVVVSENLPDTINAGYVQITPANYRDNEFEYIFTEGDTITLTWAGLPNLSYNRVDFYMAIASAASPEPIIIASDTNPSDGVSASVTLTARMAGPVTAIAYRTNGATVVTSRSVTVYTNPTGGLVVQGDVTVSPILGNEGGAAILPAGGTVQLGWDNMPNNVGLIEWLFTPTGTGTQPISIGIDSNASNGVSASWVVPQSISGYLHTVGRIAGQMHHLAESNSFYIVSQPEDQSTQVQAAYQPFENGFMLWRAEPDGIWALHDDGTVNYYPASVYRNYPENPITDVPPPPFAMPVQGFGRVWGNVEAERTALGWALEAERSYTMTVTQVGGDVVVSVPGLRDVIIRSNGLWQYE